jgi:hypothetical protein
MGEVQVYNQGALVNFEEYAMPVEAVVRQINLIQEVQRQVMKSGEHYGVIPGCGDKPSLLKAGAEKLGFTFRLRPEFDVSVIDWPHGHREYQVKCTLYHIPTGAPIGQGVGTCTTMEGKYRFRGGEKEGTGQPVPKEYWNLRNAGKTEEAKNLIGGDGFGVGKIDGQWQICIIGEKIEHDNPADYYNTCEKMAKKRAHVDAILTATAASDIFTQDVEDMPEVIPGAANAVPAASPTRPPVKEPQKKNSKKDAPPAGEQTVTCLVADVQSKSGEKNGKPYTIYSIVDTQGTKYGTFDSALADLAHTAITSGLPVNICYTDGQYGKKVVSLDVVMDAREPGQDG